MTNDKAPREFWIEEWMEGKWYSSTCYQQDLKLKTIKLIHVIEHSAYQALKLENEELRADKEQYREEGKLEHQYRQERMNDLQSEVARLREKLDKIDELAFQWGYSAISELSREALNHKPSEGESNV